MPTPNSSWTYERSAVARGMYESGKYSNAQIALHLGGVSRNAVIGKANRDGWINPNPSRGGVKPGEKRPRSSGWSRKSAQSIFSNLSRVDPGEAALPKQITPPEFLGLTLMELPEKSCHYIPGNDSLYCGQPTDDDSSYCTFCQTLVYTQPIARTGHMKLTPMNGRK